MTTTHDVERRLFFRGTRAKIDAMVAIFWLAVEIWHATHRQRHLRVPTRRPA